MSNFARSREALHDIIRDDSFFIQSCKDVVSLDSIGFVKLLSTEGNSISMVDGREAVLGVGLYAMEADFDHGFVAIESVVVVGEHGDASCSDDDNGRLTVAYCV